MSVGHGKCHIAAVLFLVLATTATGTDFSALGKNESSVLGKVVSAPTKDSGLSVAVAGGHIQRKLRSGEVPVRGVNLGSWLIAEKWMTEGAGIWSGVPEDSLKGGEFLALKNGPNREKRYKDFEDLHATFVTEDDIKAIAAMGLNTVRVPVGYWIVGGDPTDKSKDAAWTMYPKDTVKYLDKLIKEWAVKHNIAVLVSLHGAKGSQNGADHSAPTEVDKCYWSKFKENVENTIQFAKFIGDRYKDEQAFLGMGLLNEPNGDTDENVLKQYYQDAYKTVRASGNDCILTIMPLLFKQDPEVFSGFMEAPEFKNVWVEWHPYFIWGYDKLTADELLKAISEKSLGKVETWTKRKNANKLFMGEWSLASSGQFKNPESPDSQAKFVSWTEAQMKVMSKATGGWTYWSWRVYGDDKEGAFNGWSMRSVLRRKELKDLVIGK